MAKDVAIRFPAAGGLMAMGPYNTGLTYVVPADVAQYLLSRGAEPAKADEAAQPLDGRHAENFAAIRTQIAADKKGKAIDPPAVPDAKPADNDNPNN
ncbi:MAG: hypothetical protein P4L92_23050 [Rudaea sp.]|nr:hypothetical protein [Rudaea sp.]